MSISRSSIAAGIAALSLAISAAPALAQGGSGGGGGGTGGGGGGGTTATPAPAVGDPWTLCPDFAGAFTQPDGSVLFGNEVGGIGCLVARNSGGLLSIYEIRSGTGWVPTIKSSDPQKLDVQWTWPATGDRHQITVQPGKTVIR